MNAETEKLHTLIQQVADEAIGHAVQAVQGGRVIAARLKEWHDTVPEGELDEEAEAVLSPELYAWLESYLQLGSLPFADPITMTEPSTMLEAFRLLDITPSTKL